MVKRNFFIAGLHRSRTAWLANFLTYGESFCFHEAVRKVDAVTELREVFDRTGLPVVGNSDSGLLYYYAQAIAAFPEAAIVVVTRDPKEAADSIAKFLGTDPAAEQKKTAALQVRFQRMQAELDNRYVLQVRYEDLGKMETCRDVWTHCTGGLPFSEPRWQLLDGLRVNMLHERAYASTDRAALKNILATQMAVPPVRAAGPTPLIVEFNKTLAALCEGQPAALQWMGDLWEVARTWDHIIDGDPVDKDVVNRSYESLIFRWPFNPFLQAHKEKLVPVLLTGLDAWRYGNSVQKTASGPSPASAWQLYTDVPCTVAAILGGLPKVQKFMPSIRRLVAAIIAQHNEPKKERSCI